MIEHGGWVYTCAATRAAINIGVTIGDLRGRVWEHKNGVYEGFSKKYKTHLLVYQEFYDEIESAIAREKAIEGLDAGQEDRAYREIEPGLGGSYALGLQRRSFGSGSAERYGHMDLSARLRSG